MYSALHNKSSLKVVKEGGREGGEGGEEGGQGGEGGRKGGRGGGRGGREGRKEGREGGRGGEGGEGESYMLCQLAYTYLDELAPTDFHVDVCCQFCKNNCVTEVILLWHTNQLIYMLNIFTGSLCREVENIYDVKKKNDRVCTCSYLFQTIFFEHHTDARQCSAHQDNVCSVFYHC